MVALYLLLQSAAALLARRAPGPALTLAALSLGAPFFLPEQELLARATFGFHGSVSILRVIDLAKDERPWSAARRLALIFCLVDVRKVEPQPRRFDVRAFVVWLGFASATWVTWWFVLVRPPQPAPLAIRVTVGIAAFYVAFEVMMRNWVALFDMLGYRIPPLHVHPILARSVQEFWAQRWNRTVSDWLHEHCMRPLIRKRRPALGLMAAFAVSGLVHFWQVFVCLPLKLALLAGGFFVVQGLIVLAERKLRVKRWPTLAARVWTLSMVGGFAWMMIVPWMHICAALLDALGLRG